MTEETDQLAEANGPPELKQVLGALLFAARKPIAAEELHAILTQVAQNGEDAAHSFGKIQQSDIQTAIEQLKAELGERKLGLILVEVAGRFRFQTDPSGGSWVRQLLNLEKPARLSKPALETLAIIAYRQPATRAEIEALRGVNVDAMMRHLLELQLIRIVGRSDLPGRPLMYGTTQLFLEHFGLSSVKNLPGVEQLSRRDAERAKREADDRRQPAHRSPEGEGGTADPPAPERFGGQAPDDGLEKEAGNTKEANIDLSAIALATAEHPTLLRPSASEGKPSNAQRTMEERPENGSAEGTNADKEEADGNGQDESEKTEPEEEDEYEDDDEENEDEDEDENGDEEDDKEKEE